MYPKINLRAILTFTYYHHCRIEIHISYKDKYKREEGIEISHIWNYYDFVDHRGYHNNNKGQEEVR